MEYVQYSAYLHKPCLLKPSGYEHMFAKENKLLRFCLLACLLILESHKNKPVTAEWAIQEEICKMHFQNPFGHQPIR